MTEEIDLEGLQIEIADARGFALASMAIQTALVVMLIAQRRLTIEDAATISGMAAEVVADAKTGEDVKVMAQAAVRGFAKSLTSRLTKN